MGTTPGAPEVMRTGDLVRELLANAGLLARRQLALARREARYQVGRERSSALLLGAAGAVAFAALVLLAAAAGLAVGQALGVEWLGLVLAAGLLALIAAGLAPAGWLKRVRAPLDRSRAELDKEVAWARRRLT